MARNIYPVMRLLHAHKTLGLLRCVGDNVEQSLVIPDILLKGRNVEVADKKAAGVSLGKPSGPFGHLFEVVHFVGEFFILFDVGNITAGRDIKIMKFNILVTGLEINGNVPSIFFTAEEKPTFFMQRQIRENSNTVIGFLPIESNVLVTHSANIVDRKEIVAAFDFLQA